MRKLFAFAGTKYVVITKKKKKSDIQFIIFTQTWQRGQISPFHAGWGTALPPEIWWRCIKELAVSVLCWVSLSYLRCQRSGSFSQPCAHILEMLAHILPGVLRSLWNSEAWQSHAHLMLSYFIFPKGVILWKCENTLPSYINRCIVTETHFKYLWGFTLLTYI